MQCPHCYDQEETGFGFGQTKRVHLELEEVSRNNGYTFYQCPRCGHTKKRKEGVFSRGVAESVSVHEAIEAQGKKGSGLGTAAKVVGVGLAALIVAAAGSETKK